MVVVTVLSMVSFLFLDNIGQGSGPMSPFSGAIMIGVLCAAGMCIIGYPRGKTAEYGVGGLIIGAVFGFIGFSSAGQNKPVVRTASGSFNRSDLDRLSLQRQKSTQFIQAVARKLKSNSQPRGFGEVDDQSMIVFKMWSEDAKTMGIRVSDDSVSDFLERLTQKKLSTKAFKECLRETQLGEGELYEILKKELAAQLAAELMYPPAFVATAPQGFAQYVREPLRYMQQTPDQLWESFQKLNLKQSLDAVAIPVKEFVGQVGTPSEAELVAFFDKFRNNRWTDEARPGFVLMPQVRLAYLEADFEKFESGINPTDEDIRDYYEQNKDRYRAPEAKESTAPNLSDEEIEASKTGEPPQTL